MTRERMSEIERKVIYRSIDRMVTALYHVENNEAVFLAGKAFGEMHAALRQELEKEIDAESEGNDADSN